jgi:integrin beta 3
MSDTGARPVSPPAGSRHAAPDAPGHGRRNIDAGGVGQHSREMPRGIGTEPVGQHSREFPRGLGTEAVGQHSREFPRGLGTDAAGQRSRELPRPDAGAGPVGQRGPELPRPPRPDTGAGPIGQRGPELPRPPRSDAGTGPIGQHSRELPRPEPRDTGTGRAAVRPAGSGRPVSPVPGTEGTLFGSRNATAGRARPGAVAPDGYPGGRRGTAAGDGRHGTPEQGSRSGPVDPPGRQAAGPPRNRPVQWSGMPPTGTAKASAVVPPVVPGPSGVRTPAVPGRAGAMADSPSGVIQRPGGTTGNVVDRTTGRVPRPGWPTPRPAESGTGPVRRPAPARATGRVTGAVPVPGLAVPPEVPDEPPRSAAGADGRTGTGPVTTTARAAATAVTDPPPAELAGDAVGGSLDGAEIPAAAGLRQRLRTERGLRVIALVTLSVVVLLLLPLAFGIRAAVRDPVFRSLDALDVPGWAAHNVDDRSSGSRWCFLDCRFRERTAQSERPFADTQKVYAAALTAAGWRPWNVSGCPEQPISPQDGRYGCWRRDEFTLDLWVRLPECAVDAVAAQDPAALPTTGPNGVVPTSDPKNCTGSTVSIKVQNAITDQRGRPGGERPGLTGETPDPVLSNDPLLEPTPLPS